MTGEIVVMVETVEIEARVPITARVPGTGARRSAGCRCHMVCNVGGGMVLRSAWEMVQNDAEVAVLGARGVRDVEAARLLSGVEDGPSHRIASTNQHPLRMRTGRQDM